MYLFNLSHFDLTTSVVAYSTLQLTLLLIVGIVTQGLGIYIFWLVQKKFQISTKRVCVSRFPGMVVQLVDSCHVDALFQRVLDPGEQGLFLHVPINRPSFHPVDLDNMGSHWSSHH